MMNPDPDLEADLLEASMDESKDPTYRRLMLRAFIEVRHLKSMMYELSNEPRPGSPNLPTG
jgi:hypothetical protein